MRSGSKVTCRSELSAGGLAVQLCFPLSGLLCVQLRLCTAHTCPPWPFPPSQHPYHSSSADGHALPAFTLLGQAIQLAWLISSRQVAGGWVGVTRHTPPWPLAVEGLVPVVGSVSGISTEDLV